MSILAFSGPAHSYLELTGLFLGNTGIKVLGCMGALCHAFPSYGCSLWELSSAWRTLPRIWSSAKVRGTEFVRAVLHPPGSWLSRSILTLLHLLHAPCAVIGSSWAGDAPAHSMDCVGHVCSSHSPASTTLRAQLCSPASCQSRRTLLMMVFQRVWFYLWLSWKHPAVKESCTHGLGCLTLGLPFKFKLLWLIPLILLFSVWKQQQRVQEGLWVLLSWTLLPPGVTGMSSIFPIYFLDNLQLLVEWACLRDADSWSRLQDMRWWKLSEEMSSPQKEGLQIVLRLGKSSLSS